jgi:hypothetical protein
LKNLIKILHERLSPGPIGGASSPNEQTWYDSPVIPLMDCWELYKRDTTCRSSVDELAASLTGMGFYTTCATDDKYANASKAKAAVDAFCGLPPKGVNLDRLLNRMAKRLISCGNDFWLKLSESEIIRLPLDAVEKILISKTVLPNVELPYKVVGYKIAAKYGGGVLKPDVVIHWKLEDDDASQGFAIGLMQTLLLTLQIQSCERRPSYAAMKAKIEAIMPGIFEKYAGPDVLVNVPDAKEETIKKFENVVKNRKKEGNWLFWTGKNKEGNSNATISPVLIDPRTRFDSYIEHLLNQVYLGCETPLPRLFSTPGFTEASANAAKALQDLLLNPTQRDIKRTVEGEIFAPVIDTAGFDSAQAQVRLNWGSPESPEVLMSDLIAAATASVPLIRPEEFRKNAVKFGWELWDPQPQTQPSPSS